jgi:hypothetical protein
METKENMIDLIKNYFSDPDTIKPNLRFFFFPSLSYLPIEISEKFFDAKTPTTSSNENINNNNSNQSQTSNEQNSSSNENNNINNSSNNVNNASE